MTCSYCKISLKKLTANQTCRGYKETEIKALLGSVKVNPVLSFSRSEFFQSSRDMAQGMSISGVQQKLSLKVADNKLVATVEGGEFILKPSPEAYPFAAENEHTAMQISRLLGIDTAKSGLVSFNDGQLAYITRRFDRLADGNKMHQEDLMQCFDLPSNDKYKKTYEEAGRLILQVTNNKQAAVVDLIRRIILAYVMGNDDLHLKNISVQRLAGNKTRFYDKLTPNYDCLFVGAFKQKITGMGYLALGLLHDEEEGDECFTDSYNYYGYYTGYDFLELARRLGVKEKPVLSFIRKLKDKQQKMLDLIDHGYMPEEMKLRAAGMVKSGIKAMQIVA